MSFTAIAFLIGFVVGCWFAFSRHPVYGLLTYVGTFYIEPTGQWWGKGGFSSVRWLFLSAGVTLVAMMLYKRKTPPVLLARSGFVWGVVVYILWVVVQQLWALDPDAHNELLVTWLKFLVAIIMICKCIETEEHLRWFLWAHVAGCFYLGYIATTEYSGGRFEGFGASGLAEANAGALQLVTGLIIAATLILSEKIRLKALLAAMMLIIVNGVVTTMSRSGFLATVAAGLMFNLLTPKRYRARIAVVSVLGVVLFVALTNPNYWARMDTIKLKGAEVEGVDTGGGRLEIIQAQWKMFAEHPMGCGHMCTTVLSPQFLDEKYLSMGQQRASHNTIMTMLVDHGIPGGILYFSMLVWTFTKLFKLVRESRGSESFLSTVLPGVAGVLAAITVGDLFVQYPKLEVRVWFLSVVVVMLHLKSLAAAPVKPPVPGAARLRAPVSEQP